MYLCKCASSIHCVKIWNYSVIIISELLSQGGVSRSEFYEHFEAEAHLSNNVQKFSPYPEATQHFTITKICW
jgi:hypothetical protein